MDYASPWYVNCAGFELNCAGFDFLPASVYHELSFCSIQLPQFDNVGQNRMHTFAGDVDGMRRTVAIVHTDAFDDEDTQGLVLVHLSLIIIRRYNSPLPYRRHQSSQVAACAASQRPSPLQMPPADAPA